MALSSQSLSKRTCPFSNVSAPTGGSKRMCLGLGSEASSFKSSVAFISSSEDDYDLDEQTCYNADQVKAKRRASARMSFSVNPRVSKAVSKYSDEDEEEEERTLNDDNFDCKLLSANSSSICLGKLGKRNSMQLSDENIGVSLQSISSSPMKRQLSGDRNARSRCFEYLVASIDEAWARYCDLTSFDEDKAYGFGEQRCAHTPASVATDEEDYFGNSTDITDYDSEFEGHTKTSIRQHRADRKPSKETDASEGHASSSRLQELKDRLTKAKYYLQDLVDSDDINDVISFWKRWDMIKYATVELVEDDDDDDVVEGTIEDLEEGRSYSI